MKIFVFLSIFFLVIISSNSGIQVFAEIDSDIELFVNNFNFPKPQPIEIIYQDKNNTFTFFSISHGEGIDCPSGCFYNTALGIKHGDQIGWVDLWNDIPEMYLTNGYYKFTEKDYSLSSPEHIQKIENEIGWNYAEYLYSYIFKNQFLPSENFVNLWENWKVLEPLNFCRVFVYNPNVNSNIELLRSLKETLPSCSLDEYHSKLIDNYLLRLSKLGDMTPLPIKEQILQVVPQNVVCKDKYQLILKNTDFSPACVKPESITKLIERGWGVSSLEEIKKIWIERIDTQCSDPWDVDSLYGDYSPFNPKSDPLSTEYVYEKTRYVIERYFDQRNIIIFDLELVENAEPADLCEGCGCNSGGHLWRIQISESSFNKLEPSLRDHFVRN